MERSPPPRATSNRVEQYKQKRVQMADLDKAGRRRDFERQIWRKWSKGDVYAPHDLSPVEMAKHKKRKPRDRDVFDALGINPLKEYKVSFFVLVAIAP